VNRKPFAILLLVTIAALFIHGYHPAAEDAEIYIPGIVKILHPSYYPFGQEFFETHAKWTLYPHLIAGTVRLTHFSLYWVIFLWYLASIYLLLLACWKLASKCFPTAPGRWGAVALVAALLTLPVAGTSLYIFDQYLNPRSFSAFAVLFAIDAAVEKKYLRVALWLILTAVIHPFMTIFGIAFIFLLFVAEKMSAAPKFAFAGAFFPAFLFKSPSPAFWQCLRDHRYYYLSRWTWYEQLGAVAPLAIFWWFSRIAQRQGRTVFFRLARTAFFFNAVFLIAGLVITFPRSLEILTPYQPMRSLQLTYVLLALFSGGMIGEWLLKSRPLRWLLLFAPLCAGMCYAQVQIFPADRHVEWPGAASTNPWVQAFYWIRGNTPTEAIFALDPELTSLPGEGNQGFRAWAERSRLADGEKDWSAAVLFPNLPLADDCLAQVQAASGWKHFGTADFEKLKQTYGVTWVVLQQPGVAGMDCPYENNAVVVCRVK
jgi:hypothetical protein